MDLPEQRIVNSLILLAGISFLAVGVATGQIPKIIEILSKILTQSLLQEYTFYFFNDSPTFVV
jgi:hypothetical protein